MCFDPIDMWPACSGGENVLSGRSAEKLVYGYRSTFPFLKIFSAERTTDVTSEMKKIKISIQ